MTRLKCCTKQGFVVHVLDFVLVTTNGGIWLGRMEKSGYVPYSIEKWSFCCTFPDTPPNKINELQRSHE